MDGKLIRCITLSLAFGFLALAPAAAADPMAPPPPVALNAIASNQGTLLWWLPPPNPVGAPVTGYTVFRLTDLESPTWTAIGSTPSNQTQFLDAAPESGVALYYVTATSSAGPSQASNLIVSFTASCTPFGCGRLFTPIRLPGPFIQSSCEPIILGLGPDFPYIFHVDSDCLNDIIRT